jgi:hypothetical protein
MPENKKQFYPAFLRELKDRPFDRAALESAWHEARIGGKVGGTSEMMDFFRDFSIDEAHWHFHQRILHDDVLFRLLSEGYFHPTIHPVAAIYGDPEFYAFVFPFIHTAVLKKTAEVIAQENTTGMKLLMQWIEPFGTYFHSPFYRMTEYTANEVLKELASLQLNRKLLPFGTYSKISPAMMHLLNRLPQEYQNFRDRFAREVMDFAIWLRRDMKVYTQPEGLLTRLKLLNCSPDLHAQLTVQLKAWEQERALATKEKFNLNHLIWIIPLFFIAAFVIYRNTDFGKSPETVQEEKAIALSADQQSEAEKWEKINLRMENIDLNQLIAEELYLYSAAHPLNGQPVNAAKDPGRLDTGEEPYKWWLQPGRQAYAARDEALILMNDSKCDLILFCRQNQAPFMERAYYVRSEREVSIYDDGQPSYTIRVYAGTGWCDSLLNPTYDQKLWKAGLPEETRDQFPATTELRGCFLYPAKSLETNLQPVSSEDVQQNFFTPDGVPVIKIEGDHTEVRYTPKSNR